MLPFKFSSNVTFITEIRMTHEADGNILGMKPGRVALVHEKVAAEF